MTKKQLHKILKEIKGTLKKIRIGNYEVIWYYDWWWVRNICNGEVKFSNRKRLVNFLFK
jgi:hypothetical protein